MGNNNAEFNVDGSIKQTINKRKFYVLIIIKSGVKTAATGIAQGIELISNAKRAIKKGGTYEIRRVRCRPGTHELKTPNIPPAK